MKLLYIITVASILSINGSACADTQASPLDPWGIDDVNRYIHCKIKEVVVLAKTQSDCTTIGGQIDITYKNEKS